MLRGKTKRELIASLPENCFWVHNGPILSDLDELHRALKGEITNGQFEHHVTTDRNDFADWVENTLQDSVCANSFRKVKKKSAVIKKIEMCLKGYKKKKR